MKSGASEPSRSASTAVAKLNFLGGQSGPALFPRERILKPLPKRNQNFFGWLDPATQLCFAVFPARKADDGFDGMHFQIYVEGIDNCQRVAFIKLEAVEKTWERVRYASSFADFVKQISFRGASGVLSQTDARYHYPDDLTFFEYCLSMARACHTHLYSIDEASDGPVFNVLNETDYVEFDNVEDLGAAR
jgi:hypothetical protein